MKKSTILSSLAVIALAVTGAGFASAHPNYHNGHCGNGYSEPAPYQGFHCDNPMHHNGMHKRGECFYNLDVNRAAPLSEKQIAELNTLREKHFQTMRPLFEELRLKNLELENYRGNSNISKELLDKVIAEKIALENKIQEQRKQFQTQTENDYGVCYPHGPRHGRMHGHHHF